MLHLDFFSHTLFLCPSHSFYLGALFSPPPGTTPFKFHDGLPAARLVRLLISVTVVRPRRELERKRTKDKEKERKRKRGTRRKKEKESEGAPTNAPHTHARDRVRQGQIRHSKLLTSLSDKSSISRRVHVSFVCSSLTTTPCFLVSVIRYPLFMWNTLSASYILYMLLSAYKPSIPYDLVAQHRALASN